MLDRLIHKIRALRGLILWTALLATCFAAVFFTRSYIERRQDADIIQALNAGEDREIKLKSASSTVILARIGELLRRDRFDEAHALVDTIGVRSAANTLDPNRPRALFNIANYRIRQATELIAKGDFDGATALVNVAKSEYRMALRQQPDDWDFKYNLDVAMRMVRDLPQSDSDPEEVPPDAPTRVWTDLPGVPKGLP